MVFRKNYSYEQEAEYSYIVNLSFCAAAWWDGFFRNIQVTLEVFLIRTFTAHTNTVLNARYFRSQWYRKMRCRSNKSHLSRGECIINAIEWCPACLPVFPERYDMVATPAWARAIPQQRRVTLGLKEKPVDKCAPRNICEMVQRIVLKTGVETQAIAKIDASL